MNSAHNVSSARHTGTVLFNTTVAPSIYHMRIQQPNVAHIARSGQFINIRVQNSLEPVWRRPFSIHAREGDSFDILYRVIGKGTQALAGFRPGMALDFVGPLGNWFAVEPANVKTALLVGGGLGIAPMALLASELSAQGIEVIIFYGVRNSSELCRLDVFEQYGDKLIIATEDGSRGTHGFVTIAVEEFVQSRQPQSGMSVFACGPNPMLKVLSQLTEYYGIPCQVSLETVMGCGIGACLGCGMKTRDTAEPYVYICKQGPVFLAGEIDFRE